MKVLEIKGYNSMRALNAFSALAMGLKMLPDYQDYTFVDFFKVLQDMDPVEQAKKIREAVMLVELQDAEVAALVKFCADKNGVPYDATNIKNMGPSEIIECVVAVCLEIAKIKIDSISDTEKKN